jgi:endo-beta-N-acetylglucosaminidase D
VPDPKIRQRKFEWAEPEPPKLESEWTYQYQYQVGNKIKTATGLKTATATNVLLAGNTQVLTKAKLQAAVKALAAMPSNPPAFIIHPFAVKDLLDDSKVAVIDLETVEAKALIELWEENATWKKPEPKVYSFPSSSSLS